MNPRQPAAPYLSSPPRRFIYRAVARNAEPEAHPLRRASDSGQQRCAGTVTVALPMQFALLTVTSKR